MSENIRFFVLDESNIGGYWVNGPVTEAEKARVVAIGEGQGQIRGTSKKISLENTLLSSDLRLAYDTVGVLELIWHAVQGNGFEDFQTLENAITFYANHGIEVEVADDFEQILSQALLGMPEESNKDLVNSGSLRATSEDGSVTLVVENPLRWAGVGQGWVLDYKVDSQEPCAVEFVTDDEQVVTGDARKLEGGREYIFLSVGAGKTKASVCARAGNGQVAEVSWELETIMMGG